METQVGEMEKGTFSSQPVANHKDVRSTPFGPAQVNAIHTLQSGKEVDNQVVMPDQNNTSLLTNAPSSSGIDKLKEKEADGSLSLYMSHQLHFQTSSDRKSILFK